MISPEEARTRVARGAAYLDATEPDWPLRLNVGTLLLSDCAACVLGQLRGNYTDSAETLPKLPDSEPWWHTAGSYYGFSLTISEAMVQTRASYSILQDAWIDAIADRLHAQPQETNAVDPVALSGQEVVRA